MLLRRHKRLTDSFLYSAVRQVNQDAAGEQGRRQLSDCVTLIEPVLQDLVRLELNGVGLMDLPPEELVALDASDEPGLREAMTDHFAGGSASSSKAARTSLIPKTKSQRNCSSPLRRSRRPRLASI